MAEELATGDLYQRFPPLLQGELEARGLYPLNPEDHENLRLAYDGHRAAMRAQAALDAEWQAARRAAADVRDRKG